MIVHGFCSRASESNHQIMNFIHRYQPNFSLAQEFNRLLDRGREAQAPGPREVLHESDQAWILRLDLPGYTKPDVAITLTDRTLSLVAETPADRPFGGKFERQWKLGEDVETTAVTAALEHGVLEITVPKRPKTEPQPVTIEIR